jgi:hypothetical protein
LTLLCWKWTSMHDIVRIHQAIDCSLPINAESEHGPFIRQANQTCARSATSDCPRTAFYFHPLPDESLNEFRMSQNHWLANASRNVKSDNNSWGKLSNTCNLCVKPKPTPIPMNLLKRVSFQMFPWKRLYQPSRTCSCQVNQLRWGDKQ